MNSTKSPLPTAVHRLTSVTFNGKELVRYDYDGKVLKSSNNLGEEWTFDYRKDQTVVTDVLGWTADIPISIPIPTATNLWRRYTTTLMPKAKAANKPTTSTATKSASQEK